MRYRVTRTVMSIFEFFIGQYLHIDTLPEFFSRPTAILPLLAATSIIVIIGSMIVTRLLYLTNRL